MIISTFFPFIFLWPLSSFINLKKRLKEAGEELKLRSLEQFSKLQTIASIITSSYLLTAILMIFFYLIQEPVYFNDGDLHWCLCVMPSRNLITDEMLIWVFFGGIHASIIVHVLRYKAWKCVDKFFVNQT
ncbi:MAG: hypothetical protein ACFFCS_24420, partial [Candidatus Hodarchaeota archaeon]